MKLGIIGLSGSGKTSVFTALTHQEIDPGQKGENLVAAIRVPDPRIGVLGDIFKPKKTTYAEFEFVDIAPNESEAEKAFNGDALIAPSVTARLLSHFTDGATPPAEPIDVR